MTKVVIFNTTHFANKGSMGRIEGMIRCLNETIPRSRITILHRYYKQDKDTLTMQLLEKYPNLEVEEHPWFRERNSNVLTAMSSLVRFCFFCFSATKRSIFYKLGLSLNDHLKQYDAIVDLNLIEPDKLTDKYDFVSAAGNFLALLNVWYATLTKKPVIVCSATIGPYQNKFSRRVAKHVLNKVNIITLREDYSLDYLQSIGVDKPHIYLTADLAFLLEPPNTEEIPMILENINITSEDRPLVGIAPTAMMHSSLKQPQYIQLIAELTDFLIEDLNATIIYVTNTYQDEPITQKIYEEVKNKHNVRILPFNVSASETKGIVGICDVFICSRFHALVASTSLGVPSLGIVAYSRNKFHGIIGKMMGVEDYLLDVDDGFEYDAFLAELKSKVNDLWMNRNLVTENLREKAKIVREQTLLNGMLIKELIDPPYTEGEHSYI
jgi:polysaccharide pyruvyl transferase WcaK-like protein